MPFTDDGSYRVVRRRMTLSDSLQGFVCVSDVHGAYNLLKAVPIPSGYQLLSLGDMLDEEVDPSGTIDWLQEHCGPCAILGNHDEQVVHQAVSFSATINCELRAAQLAYLKTWPDEYEISWRGYTIYCMHGHRDNQEQGVAWTTSIAEGLARFRNPLYDLTLVGHTHQPYIVYDAETITANCGSVAQLREQPGRSWLIVDEENDQLRVQLQHQYE